MKKSLVLSNCPVCDHELEVKKLKCSHCETSIEGTFMLSKFNYLDQEKLYFIEIFVKNRGNIKAIEKELNISYPTVKKMLDEAIVGLGYKVEDTNEVEEGSSNNMEILKALKDKEITIVEALEKIKKRG